MYIPWLPFDAAVLSIFSRHSLLLFQTILLVSSATCRRQTDIIIIIAFEFGFDYFDYMKLAVSYREIRVPL